ncbi:MAG: hypothetical protein A3G75_06030 [Verrucomicrobia bacterium RIFCSPLOWO2_12_FULL_64_8]|nr:MAG: hypothetical protein A3G75_06030 [Verrucomicrobia bacterium RIFCSPLOWO2_12_FULL_64_8]
MNVRGHTGWAAGFAGWVLLAAVPLGAADPAPPLDELKSELKAIKRDQNTELNAPGSGPKIVLPAPAPEAAGETPFKPAAPREKPATDKVAGKKSDWLVEAMELQSRGRTDRWDEAKGTIAELKKEPLDPSDPAFLVKIYAAQAREKKAREEGNRAVRERGAAPPWAAASDDLLAEYLGHWITPENRALLGLDKSRAQEAAEGGAAPPWAAASDDLLAEYLGHWITPENRALLGLDKSRAQEAAGLGAAPVLGGLGPHPAKAAGPRVLPLDLSANTDQAALPAENPFLAGLKLDAPPARPGAGVAAAPPRATEVGRPAAPPAPPLRPPAAARPPPSPADDQKYFPQLRRF